MSKSSRKSVRTIGSSFRDLIILVIGILLSFTLTEYKQSAADDREEQRIISLLYQDLKSDTTQIQNNLKSIRLLKNNFDTIMKYKENPDSIEAIVLFSMAYSVINFVPFEPQQTAYLQFTYHENSGTVKNKEILSGVIALFTKEYTTLQSLNETHKSFLLDKLMVNYFRWFPNILSAKDFTPEKEAQILSLLENEEFLNMIQFEMILKMNIEKSYLNALDEINLVMDLIKSDYGNEEWLKS